LKERLDSDILEKMRILKDFRRKSIRLNTRKMFSQQKFNLLGEEPEGYSKLLDLLNSQREIASKTSEQLEDTIRCLIGQFDLDPNRVLDLLLEALEFSSPETTQKYLDVIRAFRSTSLGRLMGFKFQCFLV
jgi:THO complex subunit 2